MSKLTFEEVKKFIEFNSYIMISTTYKNARTPIEIKCPVGHIYKTNFDNFKNKSARCRDCSGYKKLSVSDVKNYIEVESKTGYKLLSENYIDNKTLLTIRCDVGHIYEAHFSAFKDNGNRCKHCGDAKKRDKLSHDYTYVKNYIEIESNSGFRLLSRNYINNDTHLAIVCNKNHPISITFANFKKGKRCKICFRENNFGENHHSWKSYITNEEREIKRAFPEYSKWRKEVFERDNYTCQCCGDNKGGNLNAHHLNGYDWCIEERTKVDNGITLCCLCHSDFHHIYGYGDNTKEQFNEYITDILNDINYVESRPYYVV